MCQNNFSILSFLLLIFILIGSHSVYSQTITGILKDKETNKVLPFVNINSNGTYGVISNLEGEFIIQSKYLSVGDSLVFSSMGYQSKRMALQDIDEKTIYLSPTSLELGEVFLTNRQLSPEEILEKVIENTLKNYDSGFKKYSIFKREKDIVENREINIDFKKINFFSRAERKDFNQELENLIHKGDKENQTYQDSYFHVYQNEETDFKLDPVLATRLGDPDKEKSVEKMLEDATKIIQEKLKSAHTFKVKSGLLKIQDSLEIQANSNIDSLNIKSSKIELGRLIKKYDFAQGIGFDFIKKHQNFHYDIEGMTNLDDELVYEINFEPQKNKFKYRGKLYISAESFAVVKMDYQLIEPQKTPGILKVTLGIQQELKAFSETAVFQKNQSGKYDLKYVHLLQDEQTFLNRNIQFIENNKSSDRIKLKAKLLVDQARLSDRQYMFVNVDKINSDSYNSFTEEVKIPLRIIRQYDASIWEDYNIISPDKTMRAF